VDLPNANGSRLDDPGVAAASMPGWMPILLMASIGGFILVWGFALFLLAREIDPKAEQRTQTGAHHPF